MKAPRSLFLVFSALIVAQASSPSRVARATPPRQTGHPIGSAPHAWEPAWRIDYAPATGRPIWVVAAATSERVVLDSMSDADGIALVDVRDGTITHRVPVAGWSGFGAPQTLLASPDRIVTWNGHQTAVGIDPSAGTVAWSADVARPMNALALGDGTVALADWRGLSLLDAASGRVRWRTAALNRYELAAADGRIFAWLDPTHLSAIDAISGRALWSWAGSLERWAVYPVGDRVLVENGGYDVLDASSGRVLAHHDASQSGVAGPAAVTGHVLVRSWSVTSGYRWESTDAIDIDTGRVLWRREPGARVLVAGDDAVYACSDGGRLEALDPSTGDVAWSWGIGRCMTEAIRGYFSAYAVVRSPSHHGDRLIVATPDGIVALAPASSARAPETVVLSGTITLNGRPAAGAYLTVDGIVARADRRGRYRVETTANGYVTVHVDGGMLVSLAPRRPCGARDMDDPVRLDGTGAHRRNYDFRTRAQMRCAGGARACNCEGDCPF